MLIYTLIYKLVIKFHLPVKDQPYDLNSNIIKSSLIL